ncbi:MAG: hypothetical protein QM296_12565 [Bacillota bacterium]|nr:hypothetical protein [Bacillota bacterium]
MKQKKHRCILLLSLLLASMFLSISPVRAAAGDVPINATYFPDAYFRTYVGKFDTNKNGILEQSERDAVKSVYCRSKGISSLKGIEFFSKLEELNVSLNALKEIDLSKNTSLKTVDVSQNILTDLNLSGFTQLDTLYCFRNNLSSLNITDCHNLSTLYCHHNKLKALDVSNQTGLVYLSCGDNSSMESLNVSQNTVLKYLNCEAMRLSSLDLSNNSRLESLNCSGNHITALDLSHNRLLIKLYCYNNRLTVLDLSHNLSIQKLNCTYNRFTALNLGNNNSLTELFTGNQKRIEPLISTFKNGRHQFDLSTIPYVNTGKVTNVRQRDGSALPSGASYDSSTGILKVNPDVTLAGISYDYAVNSSNFPNERMDVQIKLSYSAIPPLQIATFRTGYRTTYMVGEAVNLAARAENGEAPYRYQFYAVRSNGSRVILRNYAYSNVFTWKPVTPDTYQIGVNVKDASGTVVNQVKTVTITKPLEIVEFRTGSRTSYSVGETLALAARAEGGAPGYLYMFYAVRSEGSMIILRDYAYSNTCNWTPETADTYKLGVEAVDSYAHTAIQIKTVTVGAQANPPSTDPLQIAVFRTGSKTSCSTGETVALAARAEGGTSPYQYQFYVLRSNGSRVILRNYASSNIFSWKPVTPDTYQVGVNVKDAAGKIANQVKTVTLTKPFEVAVFRAGNKSTYSTGETVALAARGEGGTAPYRYQFYVYASNGTKLILKEYNSVNIFNWKPTTPDTYRVCVAIKDANGKVVTKALYVTVQ